MSEACQGLQALKYENDDPKCESSLVFVSPLISHHRALIILQCVLPIIKKKGTIISRRKITISLLRIMKKLWKLAWMTMNWMLCFLQTVQQAIFISVSHSLVFLSCCFLILFVVCFRNLQYKRERIVHGYCTANVFLRGSCYQWKSLASRRNRSKGFFVLFSSFFNLLAFDLILI